MIPEILLLRGLREFNRRLWFRSFPFHFGLYVLAATTGLVCVTAAAIIFGAASAGGALAGTVRWVCSATGAAGIVLVIGGAIGLLHRRLTDPALTPYTTPGDLFNLLFFIAAIGLAGLGYIARPAASPGALSIAAGLLTWDTTLQVPIALGCGLIAVALLAAYIPLTHMSHFIAKYFTYHRVRWDDAPAAGNRRIAAAMAEYLLRKPTWAAEHVKADGATTWADVASSNPARETER
jgi:nitrate reductase gamma subunit